MKKILIMLVTMVVSLVGCTDRQFVDEFSVDIAESSTTNEFNALVEKARWGNSQAYLQLADCYRDGRGVEKDFVGMLSMVAQANEFGGIRRIEDYLKEMPEGSDFRMIFDAIEKFENKQVEEAKLMSEQLVSKGVPDGYFVQAFMAMESGDTLEGFHIMELAASQGSNLGNLVLCIPELQGGKTPDVEKLKSLSDKMPFANTILAKMYMGEEDESMMDEHLAIHYLLKADENAYLSKRGARWLLGYHEAGKLQLSERDVTRLKILSGEVPIDEPVSQQDCMYDEFDDVVEVVDSVVFDTVEIIGN